MEIETSAQCPVCGYYCLGNGGEGCIDKPSMLAKLPPAPTFLQGESNMGMMDRAKHEVLVRKDNPEAVAAVREVVRAINGYDTAEYENDAYVRFEYVGTMLDGVQCMVKGAATVS